jgi:hypothetical protein
MRAENNEVNAMEKYSTLRAKCTADNWQFTISKKNQK